ncbi:MAG: polysaccharide export protein [Planctomycetes bacterium]|nr:polysaccharide export protein [Planctomycetota bacterium]
MKTIGLAFLALLIAGCSGGGETRNSGNPPETTAEERAHPGGGTPPTLPPMGLHPMGNSPLTTTRLSPPRDPVLMPGDQLDISVYSEPDLKLTVRLPEAGTFTYPLIGLVEAVGMTPNALETAIRERLAKEFLHNPQVTVTVTSFAPRKVFILGGVQKPDGYVLPPSERITLLQLISVAGGITDKAYKEFVQIVRRGPKGEREVVQLSLVDVERSIAEGKGEADIELQPEDLVMIPSAARVVYVLGAVKSPGWFEIPADTRMTASMAISRAGSYTKFASTSSIQVLRQTPGGAPKKLSVNLDDIVSGKLDADVVLEPGDVVWVPERGIF